MNIPSEYPSRPSRRRSVLETLEKPRVAVPMIVFSALIGLALALVTVRAVDSHSGARAESPLHDGGKRTRALAGDPISPRVDVRVAEADVLQPPRSAATQPTAEPAVLPAPAAAATPPATAATPPATAATPPATAATPPATVATAPAAAATPRTAAVAAPAASTGAVVANVMPNRSAPTAAAADDGFGPAVAVPVPEVKPKANPAPAPRTQRDTTVATATPPSNATAAAPNATEAERNVRDVMHAASAARQDADIYAAATDIRRPGEVRRTIPTDAGLARRLNADASRAFWEHQNVREALRLQERAFAANPDDPEIAGNLAFYYLKQQPVQAQRAHDAAVQALTSPSRRQRAGRMEDWTSLGVANALMGRATDARDALLVTSAVSNNLERVCRAGLNAVASYGDELRGPVTAMFRRIHEQGRSNESPYCAWPPNWAEGRRYP